MAAVRLGVLSLGVYEIVATLRGLRQWHRADPAWRVPAARFQVAIWAVLLVTAVVAWFAFGGLIALVVLLAMLVLPWRRRTSGRKHAYKLKTGCVK